MRDAQRSLLELGLSEKEANIYLALLEIGGATVKQIAKKSGVIRTTTYEILESLTERGLISRSRQKGSTSYIAESPARFETLLRKEAQEIEHRKTYLQNAMPQLFALYNAMEDKPGVRFYEGEEGIAAAREVMLSGTGEMLTFAAYDEGMLRLAQIAQEQRLKVSRRLRGRVVFSFTPGVAVQPMDLKNWEVRRLVQEAFPFTGEISILKGKVAAFVFKSKPLAFILESQEIADLFRVLFEISWSVAKPVDSRTLFGK